MTAKNFKVGDKVRVRKDLKSGEKYGGVAYQAWMEGYQQGEVVFVGAMSYTLRGSASNWTDEMLESADITIGEKMDKVGFGSHDFTWAIEQVQAGKKVKKGKSCWYIQSKNDYLKAYDLDGSDERDMFLSNMVGDDWEIFEEFPPIKTCSKCGLIGESIPEKGIISLCSCKKESLSDKMDLLGTKDTEYYYGKDVKEKVRGFLDKISKEQKGATENDHRRSLLWLKAEFEQDMGEGLT